MARNIQTILPAGQSSAPFTAANALTVVQANSAYEYLSSIRLTATEVSSFQFLNLDTVTYSGFRIESHRLSLGSSVTQGQWNIQLMVGATPDSNSTYWNEYLKFGYASQASATLASQVAWIGQQGYGGDPSTCDFYADLTINKELSSSRHDANMMMMITSHKVGGYGSQSGVIAGVHQWNGSIINGIRFQNSTNFRAMGTSAIINLYGKRAR